MIAFTESRTITGKVTDNQGQPIPGVSVNVKGSSSGTFTDLNGVYKITVDQKVKILIFSFVGYTTVEEKIGDRTVINVKNDRELTSLQEMVVVGYGSKRERASDSYAMACTFG